MQITDIFGNIVEVTDIAKAVKQTEEYISFAETHTIVFQEYFFKQVTNRKGRQIRLSCAPKDAKTVTNLEFYQHQLKELKKLIS